MRAAQQQLQNELAADLLDRILAASPDFFERLVVQLLTAMGYGGSTAEAARALGKSGDGGVDGVIDEDALGLDRIYVQAKDIPIRQWVRDQYAISSDHLTASRLPKVSLSRHQHSRQPHGILLIS
jgi:restriction endonuclease Mrr